MLPKTTPLRKFALVSKGGQHSPAPLRDSIPEGRPPASIPLYHSPNSVQHPDQRAAQQASRDAYAERIAVLHPEADDSPCSIRASQNDMERRCREIAAQQLRLKKQLGL